MTDANRALKQDPFLDGDDPFLDAADVERLLLGEATREEMNRPPAQQAPVDTFDDDFGDDPFLSDAAPVPAKPERVIDPVFEDVQDEVAAIQVGESLYGEVDNDVSDQPVPRISAGAFCERPETGALIVVGDVDPGGAKYPALDSPEQSERVSPRVLPYLPAGQRWRTPSLQ